MDCCEAEFATGEMVSGTRVGVGGRVAVGEDVRGKGGNPAGIKVSFWIGKKGL